MSPKDFNGIMVEEAPKGEIPKCPYCKTFLGYRVFNAR